ncbi:dol-P-Glc:Glc(2)Man(9)GlcNAc(2)-PP-Dol alpha-1,2-glucosyltransferase isoform X1 [Cucumis melo]|uniref:Dol-P-Glc:Glc(2)Man(9)GlcNAc(2)-PP-Dol alpha-1,2-glucosyltransferase n=1 Tax=Cucumis melo TaxID=3656 RepID=A0A1S3BJ26_CUCME|nr:dol-P-Glc:Glc(2)Man(9)GlcNAc(2)-PP-Dol alpha-1,2-glucosyltransferase isoform X1 [Cucumis melo]XP_050945231.1 dol-P-Glc:Glc(2)Man(9)GlcNAc(2)-PP-Dol alpha-1,2-glucosyltransferase isoform X1 [Cucumis melo]
MGRIAVAAIVTLWVVPISILVNRIVPDSYMDEIFHVPQAQKYCNGNFRSWDPMITTPPGLYYLSLAHVASLYPGIVFTRVAPSFSAACSIQILRSINGILAVLCSVLVYEIISHLRPNLDDKRAMIYAVILALYPLHWFFTFLYYTDVASLTAVLAMYLACLKKNYWLSALFGIFAVFIRQTNVIWMLFVACSGVIDTTLTFHDDNIQMHENDVVVEESSSLIAKGSLTSKANLRKRKFSRTKDVGKQVPQFTRFSSINQKLGLLDEIRAMILTMWRMRFKLLVSFFPFVIVLIAFVAFVCWNGSIVLGAKEEHAVSLHFAQIMYFGLFSALLMAPMHCNLSQVIDLFHSFWKGRPLSFFLVFIALLAGFISVQYFSIAHLYLLADNRHYPFYLWRKVINVHWSSKYLLIPAYICSWFSIIKILGESQRKIWVVAYFLATAAVLVPAPLIEFRYFTTPFYFLMLHSQMNGRLNWSLVALLYIALNAFTMFMFLFRPFYWENETGKQRFIW